MSEQVEEISTVNVRELVVKNKGTWWLIPEPPSHSFFSFFLKTNPIILTIQMDSKSVSTKGRFFWYKNCKYLEMEVLRICGLEV